MKGEPKPPTTAARRLGITRVTLRAKIRRYGLA
jgi:DNA-binding protein Fis